LFNHLRYDPISLSEMLRHNFPHIRDMALVAQGAWLLFGLPLFFLHLSLYRKGSFRFRLRRSFPKPPQMGRESLNTTRSLAIYFGLQVAARAAILVFGYVIRFDQPIPLWQEALSFPLILICHDAWFYWTHRLMHLRPLFRTFHLEHHKSLAPTVFAAYSFSIPEAVLQGLYIVVYVAFFPCTMSTLIFFYLTEIAYNVMVHSGIDLFPRFLVLDKRFGWIAGTVFHDIHHATGRMNYGLYTRFWDRLMRTEHPRFPLIYDYVHRPGNDGRAYQLLSRTSRLDSPGGGQESPAPVAIEPILAERG
jgi:sterol desaturase/sphingolipid hydroxylase (fatty acid hydroxylase superfamily)